MILISVEAVFVMTGDVGEVTVLLNAMKSGDAAAADKLLALVYNELHTLAKRYMRQESVDHTLQPNALINEADIRMGGLQALVLGDGRLGVVGALHVDPDGAIALKRDWHFRANAPSK